MRLRSQVIDGIADGGAETVPAQASSSSSGGTLDGGHRLTMPHMISRREDGQFLEASWKDLGEGWSVVCTDKGLQLSRNGRVFPPGFIPSSGAFPEIEIPQSRKHEIRFAQWRVRERTAIGAGEHPESAWRVKGRFKLRDYQAWLLRQPYGFLDLSIGEIFEMFEFLQTRMLTAKSALLALPLPYQRIGDLLFPEVSDDGDRKKRAADAHDRVESEFGRGTHKRQPKLDLSGPGRYW